MGSILAIDYGLKKIGLAVSDKSRSFTFPYGVIENKNFNYVVLELQRIVEEKEIDLILIGMPFNMDNTKGEMALKVDKFIDGLKKKLAIDIQVVDERLSSFAAEENLKESSLSAKKIKKYVDSEAARLILEEHLAQKFQK